MEEWIRGHELLLVERKSRHLDQEALLRENEGLKDKLEGLKVTSEQNTDEGSLVAAKEIMRILVYGFAVLATMLSPSLLQQPHNLSKISKFGSCIMDHPESTGTSTPTLSPLSLSTKNTKASVSHIFKLMHKTNLAHKQLLSMNERLKVIVGGMKVRYIIIFKFFCETNMK